MEAFTDATRTDAVAAVPYGWRAAQGTDGLFRIGDQAGVIPSLAGEGIDIALASGRSAALAFLDGGATAATAWQIRFSGKSRRPIALAQALWGISETRLGRSLFPLALSLLPGLLPALARATRIRC